MNLHEHQAKTLFAGYDIPVPAGKPAYSAAEALAVAEELGGTSWVVKAQVHAGGRGKAGGVRVVNGRDELEKAVDQLLGSRLVTHQTGADGQPVDRLLIEQPCGIRRELYLACLLDRPLSRLVFIGSASGGMDIEEVAASNPEKIIKTVIDPVAGLQPYQCRKMAFALGLEGKQVTSLVQIMMRIERAVRENDLSLVEINPLIVTEDDALMALDAKINIDESALYRQKALEEWRDPTQEDPKEHKANQFGLNYVALDGSIGCMVNGAGLAMATMDLIKLHGGTPANFLDVGGGTTADKVAEALKIILSDTSVKAILVNIFGGIVRCDLIAEGVISAVREIQTAVPIVVRLEGTNVEQGKALLKDSGLSIIAADGLTDAAIQAVKAAG
ncbi:MAG: ADP-forming succinate--CoA ligase subunit beta [Gammaproteobacteria bacterium]|nr:ADP-forming succinate--CoA ligase subunit beta [Gammaproteobacteria bacterium]